MQALTFCANVRPFRGIAKAGAAGLLGVFWFEDGARELEVSDRLTEETLALNYLCLCDEYGVGELSDAPRRIGGITYPA